MHLNTDLHIHSSFSMATSRVMTPQNILNACKLKGIDVVGTGDALHPIWRDQWKPYLENEYGITVVPQTEVEDNSRVHHLIFAETFDQFSELQDLLAPFCGHISTLGRPHIKLTGGDISEYVHDVGGIIGPAHVFTPWTSLFASYQSPSECYGDNVFEFCELGLSADSSYGSSIAEFEDIPFLSNSDAHSPSPLKIGREFTRVNITSNTSKSVIESISTSNIILNVGFFPEEGKYNRTACTRCYTQYSLQESEKYQWKCPIDNGLIKIGVRERADQLSTLSKPTNRPLYIKIIPLGEIIARSINVSSPDTKKCQKIYNEFINMFGNEISILIDVPESELRSVSPDIARSIIKMREGTITLYPGGGGKYGSFSI
ncbi:MAG TPA: endonuclease Q family protein [Methanocorpusculum sp.]|nr:endonuclease Q family protein [Methanocorpusculum sp.]